MSVNKLNNKRETKNTNKVNKKWIAVIILWSVILSGGISLLSDMLLRKVNILVAFVILIIIIFLGIIFDIVGVAVTAADEKPFHAMASKKIGRAKIAIYLIRNADKVSNFCNDVVGDISGIISGSMGALIVAKVLLFTKGTNATIISALIGSVIAAVTIGGKALGKNIALNRSNNIVNEVSKLIFLIKKDRW